MLSWRRHIFFLDSFWTWPTFWLLPVHFLAIHRTFQRPSKGLRHDTIKWRRTLWRKGKSRSPSRLNQVRHFELAKWCAVSWDASAFDASARFCLGLRDAVISNNIHPPIASHNMSRRLTIEKVQHLYSRQNNETKQGTNKSRRKDILKSPNKFNSMRKIHANSVLWNPLRHHGKKNRNVI